MMNKFGFAVTFWVLAILCLWIPASGTSLRCHVCNSLYNESCEVITDNRYLMDCYKTNTDPERNHTICRKEVFSVSSVEFEMSSSRTIRTCGYRKHPKFSCFYNSNHDLKETICECEEDGCNEGSALHFTFLFLISSLLASYFMTSIFM
ncbi:uncharacterized protein CDAR_311152 [Caerostris darwini]|uniref:Protein quiver n=1 Tax=Caerostris darwini TaxID=1538125 RepID=A0AAV4WSN6_9ARAC|nr:uncharacterized protein CDAR_311152 [Caerostris darwini]